MQKKQWISLVGFILCAVLLLSFISELMRDKGSSFDAYYEEPENTIDAIFVGSSHVYSGYCPAVLWREYGVSAYNVYAWSQPVWTSYYYIREALKTQSPQVVFLDVSGVVYNMGGTDWQSVERTNREENITFNAGWERFALTIASQTPESPRFDLELYHNKWKYPDRIELIHKNDTSLAFLRNAGLLFETIDYEIFNYSFYTDVTSPSDKAVHYLEKITELSEKEGFRLVYILTPYTSNEQQNAAINWIHQYADEHGIDFLDFMREDGAASGFDYQADMADGDHVNVHGAFKLTRHCGEYLKSLGLTEQRDKPNAAALDQAADATYRMIEYTFLFDETCTPQIYGEWLAQNQAYHAAIITPQNITAQQLELFEQLDFEPTKDSLVAIQNGELKQEFLFANNMAEIEFPNTLLVAEQAESEITINLGSQSLWTGSQEDLIVVLYDDPLEQLVYIVSFDPQGVVNVQGFSQEVRGMG